MKKIGIFVSLITFTTLSSFTFASDRTVEEVYKQCGIGGLFFGESSPTLAFISNVTWDLGTTAATSDATDGCAVDSSSTTAAIFIHETYDMLERDIVKGSGDHLDTLATLFSCAAATRDDVMAEVRAEFSSVVTREGYAGMNRMEKADALFQIVSPRLSNSSGESCAVS